MIPIIKKVIEAIDLRITSGKKLEIEPPVKAPIKLANTSADEDPKKTANGLFEVPLIVNVANWVLSPNSAIKTVRNVDSNKLKTIYKYFSKVSKAKRMLINIIRVPVKRAKLLGDILFDNHLPIRTPTILELIKATELPRKTITGLPDSAESIKVAICVLSPSSAINIVVKVVKNIDKKLLSILFSSFSNLLFIFLGPLF